MRLSMKKWWAVWYNVNLFEQNRTTHTLLQQPYETEFYSQLNLIYDGSMQQLLLEPPLNLRLFCLCRLSVDCTKSLLVTWNNTWLSRSNCAKIKLVLDPPCHFSIAILCKTSWHKKKSLSILPVQYYIKNKLWMKQEVFWQTASTGAQSIPKSELKRLF